MKKEIEKEIPQTEKMSADSRRKYGKRKWYKDFRDKVLRHKRRDCGSYTEKPPMSICKVFLSCSWSASTADTALIMKGWKVCYQEGRDKNGI